MTTIEETTLRLCYVKGAFAYFASMPPGEVWGDDWNDVPYEHNAGTPYEHIWRGEEKTTIDVLKVAFDGWLETPADRAGLNSSYSVQSINAGTTPWLYGERYDGTPPVTIMAGATLAEFRAAVASVGGAVYLPAQTAEEAR